MHKVKGIMLAVMMVMTVFVSQSMNAQAGDYEHWNGELNPTSFWLREGSSPDPDYQFNTNVDDSDSRTHQFDDEWVAGVGDHIIIVHINFTGIPSPDEYPVYLNLRWGTTYGCDKPADQTFYEAYNWEGSNWHLYGDIPLTQNGYYITNTSFMGEFYISSAGEVNLRFNLAGDGTCHLDIDHIWLDVSAGLFFPRIINIWEELNETKTILNEYKHKHDGGAKGVFDNHPYVVPITWTGAYEGTRGSICDWAMVSGLDLGTLDYLEEEYDCDFSSRIIEIDPYWTMIYTANNTQTRAKSVDLWSPYDSTLADVQILSDEVWLSIGNASGTAVYWVNDTDSNNLSETYGLDAVDQLTHFSANGENMTIEISGGDVRVDRYTRVKIADEFTWSYDLMDKLYYHTEGITNALGIDMRDIFMYWSFPNEDDMDRPIYIDISSVQVKDLETNTILELGKNYDVSESGISFGLESILNSDTRQFNFQWKEKPLVSNEIYREFRDYDVSLNERFDDSPYYVGFVITQPITISFHGRIIVGFVFTQTHSNQILSKANTRVFVNGQNVPFSYDSSSNELTIHDITFESQSQNDVQVYFQFLTAETSLEEFVLTMGLGLFIAGLLATFVSASLLRDWKKKDKKVELLKRMIVWFFLILGLVLMAMSGIVQLF